MKYQIIFLFLLLIMKATTLVAQQNDSTTIKVILPEAEDTKNAKVILVFTHPVFFDLTERIEFTPSKDNLYEHTITFPITKPKTITIDANAEWYLDLLAFPNDKVEIILNKGNQVKFTKGKTTRENQATHSWKGDFLLKKEEFTAFDWKEALQKMDSLANSYLTTYENEFRDTKPNPIFDSYFRSELKLTHITAAEEYKWSRKRFLDKPDLEFPQEYKQSIPIYDLTIKKGVPYTTSYIYNVMYNKAKPCEVVENKVAKSECTYKIFQKLKGIDEELRKLLYFSVADGILTYIEMGIIVGIEKHEAKELNDYLKVLMTDLASLYPNTKELSFLEAKINEKQLISEGQLAPIFSLKNQEGKEISLSELRGKYVLIDFWSTWCKPCLREIPFSKELEKDFSNDVEFVYICLSSEEEKWKEMVVEKDLQGHQLFANGESQKQIEENYQVSFYPTYILIDREGKVITKNVRPSQNAKQIIEQALNEEK